MKLAQSILLVLVLCAGCRTARHSRDAAAPPDFAALKTGMLLSEFQRLLGMPGDMRPGGGPGEAIVDFDFDNRYVLTHVAWGGKLVIVTEFSVQQDELSAADRKARRAAAH